MDFYDSGEFWYYTKAQQGGSFLKGSCSIESGIIFNTLAFLIFYAYMIHNMY